MTTVISTQVSSCDSIKKGHALYKIGAHDQYQALNGVEFNQHECEVWVSVGMNKSPLTRAHINRLQKRAALEPASEAMLLWTFVWGFVTCGLMWVFSAQAFPEYDGAQGVSLPWVGSLLTIAGFIAVGLCYLLYEYRTRCKEAAIAELKEVIAQHRSGLSQRK